MQQPAAKAHWIASRHTYRCCHIYLPDLEQPVAAISYQSNYYSLFRVEPDQTTALKIAEKLGDRNEVVAITQIPKGYAIWVQEQEAQPTHPTTHRYIRRSAHPPTSPPTHLPTHPSTQSPTSPSTHPTAPYQVLTSPQQYRPCWIALPGKSQPRQAIAVQNNYYSLLDVVPNIKDTAHVVKRLARRDLQTAVTKVPNGYGIWLLEPTAQPIPPAT
ncbi:MAG: hypothetical protein VKK04_09725 [Synechococcales bacterium]|nr:hypothetical protein [Synechococcales bacterium]